jgi:hypothetical protein
MKKSFYSLIACAVLCLAACTEKGPDENGGKKDYVDYSGGKINLVLPVSKTVEADADGVSVSIKDVTNASVTFECRPGANVQSYRLDVIPLAMLYNTIINEGLVGASKDEVEDLLITLLTSSPSVNGVVFTEDTFEDFYSHTFDWVNTEYSNGGVLCDCDYVICIIPCFDDEGLEPSGVNLAYFKTDAPALVGNPDVRIDVSVSYRAFQAVHEPNDDCKWVCYWSYITEQIDDYVDVVGERMLRDFVRAASVAYDVANTSDMQYHVDFGQLADAQVSQTTLALALDVNGTPAEYVARRDFNLKPIPDSPEAVYSISPAKAAASIFWIQVDFAPTCRNCYYRWMSVEEAVAIKAYSADQKKAYARDLVETGWGVSNPKFSFDAENNVPTGDEASVLENQIVAYKPHEKYIIVSAGENYYGEVTDLQFSEPVVMKKRTIDAPSTCLVSDDEFSLILDNVTRTGFRYNFNYTTPDEIALHYFQIVSPVDPEAREANPEMCPPEDIYGASHADWMKFFFETYVEAADGEKVLQVNAWDAEPSGHDGLAMFGYEPGVEYVVAYCVEDMNGVISNVRFQKVTTAAVAAGDNPQASIDAKLSDGEWTFTFSANEDTGTLLYMTSTYGDANYDLLALPYIIKDVYGDYPTYDSIFDIWDEKIMDLGLTTKSLTTYSSESAREDDKLILALCLPVGEDASGKPVYGPLQHVLIVNGQVKHLEDYRSK